MSTFISLDNLKIYDEEIKKYIEERTKEEILDFGSRLNFPLIGDEQCLYVDSGQNKVYRWSSDETKYYCVGSDWNDIEIINGQFD